MRTYTLFSIVRHSFNEGGRLGGLAEQKNTTIIINRSFKSEKNFMDKIYRLAENHIVHRRQKVSAVRNIDPIYRGL